MVKCQIPGDIYMYFLVRTLGLAHNRRVSQMRAPIAACREPVGSYNRLLDMLYVFEHKMQYLLIHAPYTRVVVFWQVSNTPP